MALDRTHGIEHHQIANPLLLQQLHHPCTHCAGIEPYSLGRAIVRQNARWGDRGLFNLQSVEFCRKRGPLLHAAGGSISLASRAAVWDQ